MKASHTPRPLPRQAALLLGAAFALGGFLPVQAAPAQTSAATLPDSFIPTPAPNVQALLNQVQANPQVRRRYARYFHVPEARVPAYLRANLVVSRLSGNAKYTMFCVHPSGLIYPTEIVIPQGSHVFALRGGPAVLTCPEGNPLVRFQKAVETHVVRLPAASPEAAPAEPPRQIVTPTPPREIVVPTSVPTLVYQAVSPLTPAERADTPPAPPPPPADAKP